MLGADEAVVAVRAQRRVLSTPDLVERVVHVSDDVEAVEHDLVVGLVDNGAQMLDVWLLYVDRDCFDGSEVVDGVATEAPQHAVLGAVLCEVDDVLEVADHRRVALAFGERLLVDTEILRRAVAVPCHEQPLAP